VDENLGTSLFSGIKQQMLKQQLIKQTQLRSNTTNKSSASERRNQMNIKRQRMTPLGAFFMSAASVRMRYPIVDSDQSFRSSKLIYDHMLLISLHNIGESR